MRSHPCQKSGINAGTKSDTPQADDKLVESEISFLLPGLFTLLVELSRAGQALCYLRLTLRGIQQ
jgi:hypothetical protein